MKIFPFILIKSNENNLLKKLCKSGVIVDHRDDYRVKKRISATAGSMAALLEF